MAESGTVQRVVLTGATGQLGSHVLEQLAGHADVQVLALVRSASATLPNNPNFRACVVDFSSQEAIASALSDFQPTTFIHAAATGMLQPRPSWPDLIQFNVNVSASLCRTAAQFPGCHFVHVSSGLAYRDLGRALSEDDPLESQHPYAATKIAAEAVVRAIAVEAGMALTIVRPFSFSGRGDTGSRLFPSLLRAASEGKSMNLSSCEQVRDHCAVADVARGILSAVKRRSKASGGPRFFNLGSASTATLRTLIEQVVSELGLNVTLNFGARPVSPTEPKYLVADIQRAGHELDWKPAIRFPHAVWQLARASFPALRVNEPRRGA